MKKVILEKYEASDGKLFNDQPECEEYEANGYVQLKPLPNYGDHGPVQSDGKGVLYWALNGDGSGYYATKDKMSRIPVRSSDHPEWATHVIYFGK